jgi:hypothetical protein
VDLIIIGSLFPFLAFSIDIIWQQRCFELAFSAIGIKL